jgi:ATP-dependent DNA helicase RecG
MSNPVTLLEQWMKEKEGEILEFKAARNDYDFEKLTQYCVALANEGGGKIILGVSDERPRRVVGSNAFTQPERTRAGLNQRLHLGIDFDLIQHPNGRVLVFHVPGRPVGIPIQYDGRFLIRDGDSLVGMPAERLRAILAEAGHDFSADVCPGLSISDLDDGAIEEFRRRWIDKAGNKSLEGLTREQVLIDVEVVVNGGVTYAALILFGRREALGRHLAQAEVTYEYRSSDASGPASVRQEFREGFFLWYDRLWQLINQRNEMQHYQDGLFVLDVPTFHERGIREGILNAISHRNYQLGGNVFVRQYLNRIEIVSPGGLPVEVKLDTILYRQSPRNRRVADVFTKCGLVERSGQGMNLMFESAIQQGKSTPQFTGTDEHQVCVTLQGVVLNPIFVRFLRSFDDSVKNTLSTDDWLTLERLSREEPLPEDLIACTVRLSELGMVSRAGKGRFILAESYYQLQGREETFRRLRKSEQNKELLERHIADHAVDGSPLRELVKLLPKLNRDKVRAMLDELRAEGRIHSQGTKRGARWFPGSDGGG